MQYFTIDLGPKELFSLKNFTFEIQNNGSADLSVDTISPSSKDISLISTSLPFYIIQNKAYTVNGYLKVLYQGDISGNYYIDFGVS